MPTLAVVTGGNRGLGFEVCRELARRGHGVILTSRDEGKGAAAAARLAAEGLTVESRPLDVTDPDSIARLAAGLARQGARVEALVNNAGGSFRGFDAAVAARTLATNFSGPATLTDALLPLVPRGGRVVMVSSGMGDLGGFGAAARAQLLDPAMDRARLEALAASFVEAVRRGEHARDGWPSNAYAVSKALLNAFVRVEAPALEGRGIMLNAVCPGWVRTDMGGESAPRSTEEGAAGIVWAATLPAGGPTGGFFRDGRPISW
jgi:NAD(P)-dependent dehydrogenase (short-subunit alcohol dehydrogenase family)